ncbi:hypothetical protein [Pseudorhodoplanes sp.]|uniref:hypothetical protein n=1 Tax=Pseudorhodoplanes sp. TaxID=1934341 RepID=UPI002BB34B85|nr:hypothetical protein [Pseudorhodoplanes sp.]HWV53201.1 hypothetical protein [Pseudorhodoplanes sp.]
MAMTAKAEARALDADERDLVQKSHHPALQQLSDQDLSQLVKLVRERRDRAKTQANQRRREMRGKAAPKGATASKADEGSKAKLAVLAMAVRRLNSETERRRRMRASIAHVESAQRALAMKEAKAENGGAAFNSRQAHTGMRNKQSQKRQQLLNPMERGRLRKAQAVAQAKRDAR